MNKQEQIEKAEVSIRYLESELEVQKQKLADLKKQPEPKEGEWWYFNNRSVKGVVRYKKNRNDDTIDYSEGYFEYYSDTDSCCDNCLKHIATTEEITYFMGLHADRLGMKEGATIEQDEVKWLLLEPLILHFEYGELRTFSKMISLSTGNVYDRGSYLNIRNSDGTWATVLKDEPKPIKNGKLKAKIAELEAENKQLNERLNQIKELANGKR